MTNVHSNSSKKKWPNSQGKKGKNLLFCLIMVGLKLSFAINLEFLFPPVGCGSIEATQEIKKDQVGRLK